MERTKEDVRDARGTRFLMDTAGDVAFAWRTLSRSPGFAIVAILTLAIGIGGTTAVYSAVDAVLVQPLPYQEPGRLVRLYFYYDHNRDERGFVSPVLFLDYRSKLAAFDGAAAVFTYREDGADVGTGDRVRRVRVLNVSADYFDVIRTRPRLGAPFGRESENGAPLAIVSDGFWKDGTRGGSCGGRPDRHVERRRAHRRRRDACGLRRSLGAGRGRVAARRPPQGWISRRRTTITSPSSRACGPG